MKVRFKVWLEEDGKAVISEGRYRLLKEIERTGSILEASKRVGLTYKRAHSQIKSMEKNLGKKVVNRKRGTGATLTDSGRELLRVYESVLSELSKLANELEATLK